MSAETFWRDKTNNPRVTLLRTAQRPMQPTHETVLEATVPDTAKAKPGPPHNEAATTIKRIQATCTPELPN